MSKRVRLFHSIWAKIALSDRWGYDKKTRQYADFLCAATSVAFAKKNKCDIVLHTDLEGKDIYQELPYDEVLLTLKDHSYNPAFWASGKIIAQEIEPLGSIFIDADVFIKRESTVSILKELKDFDLIAQNYEYDYQSTWNKETWKNVVAMIGTKTDDVPAYDVAICHAFNCGLVGFNNQALKDTYTNGYKLLYKKLVAHPEFEERKKDMCVDLIVEQAFLYNSAKHHLSKVKVLLDSLYDIDTAVNIAYTHLINTTKYDVTIIAKTEDLLKLVDEKTYNKTLSLKHDYYEL